MEISKDLEKLQGTWKVMTLQVEGQEVQAEFFPNAKIVVDGGKFSTEGMGSDHGGRITTGVIGETKTFDLLFNEGPHVGLTSHGIYEFNGSQWRICLGFAGRERPKEFATTPGSGHALEMLEREI